MFPQNKRRVSSLEMNTAQQKCGRVKQIITIYLYDKNNQDPCLHTLVYRAYSLLCMPNINHTSLYTINTIHARHAQETNQAFASSFHRLSSFPVEFVILHKDLQVYFTLANTYSFRSIATH